MSLKVGFFANLDIACSKNMFLTINPPQPISTPLPRGVFEKFIAKFDNFVQYPFKKTQQAKRPNYVVPIVTQSIIIIFGRQWLPCTPACGLYNLRVFPHLA